MKPTTAFIFGGFLCSIIMWANFMHHRCQKQDTVRYSYNDCDLDTLLRHTPLPTDTTLLAKNVSVLVWVMTHPANLQCRAVFIKRTWGSRFDKLLFVSDSYDKDLPTLNMTLPSGRGYLSTKTMAAFDYIYKNYVNEYDWFMKADDDTYVIVENLRYFLSDKNPRDPVYFGHFFPVIVTQGYHSGGSGYVLSREALTRFGQRQSAACPFPPSVNEDVEMGRCLEKHGIKAQQTLDKDGKTTFHVFNPGLHIRSQYPDWYYEYTNLSQKQKMQVSDYAVTFHYMTVQDMADQEFYRYHLKTFGKLY